MFLLGTQSSMKAKIMDKTLTFSKLTTSKNRVDFKFSTYNDVLKCGGWITEGYFIGNTDDISDNLFELLDCVYLKKRSLEGIKIYSKTK